ncbi:Argonaute complex, subunit Arb1 [Rhypophila decipiens]|uniref:Argonaute complex, subunit Arb1 n=1 Tax=Rhypophila decipiens TaxID=261697 RepID=A0AAN6Y7U2_9PEZI|nr:Argonaute complex, subunit Arb1 [Rhypophila decipiens]
MASAPENNSATVEDEVSKLDLSETHGQSGEENKDPEGQPQEPGEGEGEGEGKSTVLVQHSEPAKKKKSRGRKGGKKKATGFEEFFCDPPLTPKEYEEEKTVIYPLDRPFVDRIEECIQRFRARRRMDSERDVVFSRYLALGGVDCTTRQFQSTRKVDPEDLEGLSKAEVREITADDVVQRGDVKQDRRWYNPEHPEHWEVDFAGVAAGFCSVEISDLAVSDESLYRMGVETIFNFLKYVEHHEVCLEYVEDVRKAQKVCETALDEMPTVVKVTSKLPGAFNTAAAYLFCDGPEEEVIAIREDSDWQVDQKPLDGPTARVIFGTAVAILLDPELGKSLTGPDAAVVDTEEGTFEIVNISLANDRARSWFRSASNHLKPIGVKLQTCGFITVRPKDLMDGYDNSLNEALSITGEVKFILDESILQDLKVGQTIQMTVCTMNAGGFKFIKSVRQLLPTFYTFLPQKLMVKFKEPVPDRRPAPSIHSPNYQEEALAGIPVDNGEEMDV